jgi:hypothetical protein
VKIFAVILGLVLILMVLWETFETIVLPRRVTRQFRLTRFFYRVTPKRNTIPCSAIMARSHCCCCSLCGRLRW